MLGAIKAAGVVNMVSSLQEDLEFGGCYGVEPRCSFLYNPIKKLQDILILFDCNLTHITLSFLFTHGKLTEYRT